MQRYGHIDIAKGIGILAVVFFHIPYVNELPYVDIWGGWIVTVYVPLFFLLNGLFFKADKLLPRVRKYLVSYIVFYVAGFIYESVKKFIKYGHIDFLSFFMPFTGATLGYFNTPLWFLLALTEMSLIGYVILKYFSGTHAFIISLCLGVIGYFLGRYGVLKPYYVSVSLTCMPFFIGGYIFRDLLIKGCSKKFSWALLSGISLLFYLPNMPRINVSQSSITCTYCQFVSICIFAIIGIVLLSMDIYKYTKYMRRVLEYYGSNSLIMLCTHMFFVNLSVVLYRFTDNRIVSTITAFILILIIETFIIELINRKLKILIGRQ